MLFDKANAAHRQLLAQLDEAAITAFDGGSDFARARAIDTEPGAFEPFPIHEPVRFTLTVKAGPVPAGADLGPDFIVYRRPDDWAERRSEYLARKVVSNA